MVNLPPTWDKNIGETKDFLVAKSREISVRTWNLALERKRVRERERERERERVRMNAE